MQNWGEWDRDPTKFFADAKCNVGLEQIEGDFARHRIKPPADWDGAIEVTYTIKMMKQHSEDRENFGLMPWCSKTYGQGFTTNTLMDLFQDGNAIKATRRITFDAGENDTIVSGWAPLSKRHHKVELSHPIDNTVILFGDASAIATGKSGDCDIEIVQFGEGEAIAKKTKSSVASLVKSYGDSTGLPLKHPAKVFLTDTGGGGTNVDGAMVVGYSTDEEDEYRKFAHQMLTAHELYHEWLGAGFVKVYKEAVWFQEGFTDYLALWHLAHLKLISGQRMIDRLEEIADGLRGNTAMGKIAFGDSTVNWRDNDGPIESMAYKGGALLAFLTDVELRRNGKPGLSKMITDLQRLGRPVKNEDIKEWYYQNGLEDFHKKWIEKADFPMLHQKGFAIESFKSALSSIGYKLEKVPTVIPYSGISTSEDGQIGTVSTLASDGPAEKAGVQVGDQIVGYWMNFPRKVELDEKDAPKHTFGFDKFRLGETIHLDLFRDNKKLQLDIEPVQMKGVATVLEGVIDDEKKFDLFFEFGPAKDDGARK